MKKAERLLDLITFLLNAREPVSFREIQYAFPEDYQEGSEETIARKFERDKADIAELGLPLMFVKGEEADQGGYIIDREGYALPSIPLSSEELAVLYLAGSAVLDMDSSPFTRDLVMALNKIAFASGEGGKGGFNTLQMLSRSRLGDVAAQRQKEYSESLRRAIADRKSVVIYYHSLWQDRKTRRKVDPYGLVYQRGSWILVGHCHLRNALRVFHVDRITGLEVNRYQPKTPDFEYPGDFQLKDHVAKHPWTIRVHEPVKAKVRFEPPVAKTIAAELGLHAEEVEKDGEARIVSFEVSFLEGLLPTILRYRDKAQVLSPPDLREKTKVVLQRLAGEAR